jgi:hypothetical protein
MASGRRRALQFYFVKLIFLTSRGEIHFCRNYIH